MGAREYGIGLGLGSLVAGVVAVAGDEPAAGLVAGITGLGGVLWSIADRRSATPAGADPDLAPRVEELETELEAAARRAAAAEAALERAEAAGGEPDVPPLSEEEAAALVDPVTGLYGDAFFDVTVTSRVAAARRHLRPVAVVLIEVAAGIRSGERTDVDPAEVARHVRATLREADTACHLDGGRFGLVLEDTPENGAVWTVERVRRALGANRRDLTLWAGVACYPAHAFDAGELLVRATAALDAAKEWRQDRIEVATTSDV